MKLPSKKIVLIFFLVIVVACLVGYLYLQQIKKNTTVQRSGLSTLVKDKNSKVILSFPFNSSVPLYLGRDKNWVSMILQGTVEGYEDIGDSTYMNFSYNTESCDECRVRILLKTDISKFSNYKDKWVDTPLFQKDLKNSYLGNITVYKNQNLIVGSDATVDQKDVYSIEEFKQYFDAGTALAIRGFSIYPEKSLRTSDFCDKNGVIACLVSDLVDKYTLSNGDFWNQKQPVSNEVIVPVGIYDSLIFEQL